MHIHSLSKRGAVVQLVGWSSGWMRLCAGRPVPGGSVGTVGARAVAPRGRTVGVVKVC